MSTSQRFRKMPVLVEARQLVGTAAELHAVYQWVEENTAGSFEPMAVIEGREPCPASGVSIDPRDGRLMIATLEGFHHANVGDWIIRGVQGEFYPCKPDIFAKTHEQQEPQIVRVPVGDEASYVYVASSWRNPLQPWIVKEIRATGIAAYDFRHPEGGTGFAWSEIDPEWERWSAAEYVAALDHPRAVEGFRSDFEAMQAADIVVLILPCGRSAHLELGWAVGAGKRTAILTSDGEEPELMAKMVDHIATNVFDLFKWLAEVAR